MKSQRGIEIPRFRTDCVGVLRTNLLSGRTRRSRIVARHFNASKAIAIAGLSLLIAAPGFAQMNGPNAPDMQTIHKLFADNKKVKRTVKNLPNGVEALTESSDPKVVALLQEHVAAMKVRLEKKWPMRMWDPLFAVLFQNADKVTMTVTNTKMGVKIVETSSDPYVVKLLQAHGGAVSGFVKDGMSGMHVSHPAPPRGGKPTSKEPEFVGKGDGEKTCPVTGEPTDPTKTALWKGKTIQFCCPSCVAAFQKNPTKYLRSR